MSRILGSNLIYFDYERLQQLIFDCSDTILIKKENIRNIRKNNENKKSISEIKHEENIRKNGKNKARVHEKLIDLPSENTFPKKESKSMKYILKKILSRNPILKM